MEESTIDVLLSDSLCSYRMPLSARDTYISTFTPLPTWMQTLEKSGSVSPTPLLHLGKGCFSASR